MTTSIQHTKKFSEIAPKWDGFFQEVLKNPGVKDSSILFSRILSYPQCVIGEAHKNFPHNIDNQESVYNCNRCKLIADAIAWSLMDNVKEHEFIQRVKVFYRKFAPVVEEHFNVEIYDSTEGEYDE